MSLLLCSVYFLSFSVKHFFSFYFFQSSTSISFFHLAFMTGFLLSPSNIVRVLYRLYATVQHCCVYCARSILSHAHFALQSNFYGYALFVHILQQYFLIPID